MVGAHTTKSSHPYNRLTAGLAQSPAGLEHNIRIFQDNGMNFPLLHTCRAAMMSFAVRQERTWIKRSKGSWSNQIIRSKLTFTPGVLWIGSRCIIEGCSSWHAPLFILGKCISVTKQCHSRPIWMRRLIGELESSLSC
jgi:hypothetical protein